MGDSGSIAVICDDRQGQFRMDTDRWTGLAREVLIAEAVEGPCELALAFIEAEEIASLKATYLEGDGNPTDVLAFPLDPVSDGTAPMRLLGDVLICPEVAARNAEQNTGYRDGHAGSFEDEMSLLIVHGVLHILGMDHHQEADAAEMREREQFHLDLHWGPSK